MRDILETMTPRVGEVWKVKHYHYPMMILEVCNGSLTLAPADRDLNGDGWIHYGMLRLVIPCWDGDLVERLYTLHTSEG